MTINNDWYAGLLVSTIICAVVASAIVSLLNRLNR